MSGASLRAFVVIQEGGMMGGMNIFTVRLDVNGIRWIIKELRQLLIQKEIVCVSRFIQTV
jgi:hypothetical protein